MDIKDEERLNKIDNKVESIIAENTKAFNQLSDTLKEVMETMKTLTAQVIENQRITAQLSISLNGLTDKMDRFEARQKQHKKFTTFGLLDNNNN